MDWKKNFIVRPRKERRFIVYKDKEPQGTCDERSAAIYLKRGGYQLVEINSDVQEVMKKDPAEASGADTQISSGTDGLPKLQEIS